MMNVSFIGLGAMGAPMARRILAKGFPLTVWNRTVEKATPFTAYGARLADSPRAAAEASPIVCTMLSDPAAVETVATGAEGLVTGLADGKVWLDFSTVFPADSQRWAAMARRKGADFCDVPVAGSVVPATEGTLGILAGGEAKTLELVRPVLQAVSSRVEHFGPVGQGAAMKLANNLLYAVALTGFGEAMLLAKRFGIPEERAAGWLLDIPAAAPYLRKKWEQLKKASPTHFALELMDKDLRLMLDGAPGKLPVTEATRNTYQSAKNAGLGAADCGRIVTHILSRE